MDHETLLSVLNSATQLTKGLASLVDNASGELQGNEADNVRTAVKALNEASARLEQVVSAKLGVTG